MLSNQLTTDRDRTVAAFTIALVRLTAVVTSFGNNDDTRALLSMTADELSAIIDPTADSYDDELADLALALKLARHRYALAADEALVAGVAIGDLAPSLETDARLALVAARRADSGRIWRQFCRTYGVAV
jgi:hypothetical protein